MSDWTPGASPWIVCAAVRYPDGKMLVGPRHFDAVMHSQFHLLGITADEGKGEEGFIDQFGRFHDRYRAWEIAERNGQIKREVSSPGRLFSENLY